MTGMEQILKIRRRGAKPGHVFVQLGNARPDTAGLGHGTEGIVTVRIRDDDSIASLDFRLLTGLIVTCEDFSENTKRHRAVCAAIAKVDPAKLVMPITVNNRLVCWHIRTAGNPPTTETYTV